MAASPVPALALAALFALAPVTASAQSATAGTTPPGSAIRAANPSTGQTVPNPRVSSRQTRHSRGDTGAVRRGPTIPNTGTPRIIEQPRQR